MPYRDEAAFMRKTIIYIREKLPEINITEIDYLGINSEMLLVSPFPFPKIVPGEEIKMHMDAWGLYSLKSPDVHEAARYVLGEFLKGMKNTLKRYGDK